MDKKKRERYRYRYVMLANYSLKLKFSLLAGQKRNESRRASKTI